MNQFEQKLKENNLSLSKSEIQILQVNLGKLCNMTCSHCHVEAGPQKTRENMDEETANAVIRLMDFPSITTLDLTGGAPEMNPFFKKLVLEAKRRGFHVIDRCNLTILFESGQEDLANFLRENQVEVIASLPCYSKENVDTQRGRGTFQKSIDGLLLLNHLGYGMDDTGLKLNLVYNPVGPHLPPAQESLEVEYKERLMEDFGIIFNSLYTITNMPITRYKKFLKAKDDLEGYNELLINNFNPHTLDGLMCRNTLSVSWEGRLFDCDFNQMLEMQLKEERPLMVQNVRFEDLENRKVLLGDHCFACTAGAGSSCQGALEKKEEAIQV